MPAQLVTVFGGTGFLGRRIVRHLLSADFVVRVASRHPDRAIALFPGAGVQPVRADINSRTAIEAASGGAAAVVNAVSLYVEHGQQTFHSVHVEGAARVAESARRSGAERVVHTSGIGADPATRSRYIRARGEGEAAVFQAFPSAAIVRPAVMFGPDDAFLAPLAKMLRWLPAFPLFGSGETRLQPVYVEDVAEAVVRILGSTSADRIYELAGPHVCTYADLLRSIAATLGKHPLLVPMPFPLWRALGYAFEFLPRPPITLNQVDLMARDNVAAPAVPGFAVLGITPKPIEKLLPDLLEGMAASRQPAPNR